MKICIVYMSYGGNTRDLANAIKKNLSNKHMVDIYPAKVASKETLLLEGYDYYIFGSLTWDNGKLPPQMRKLLKIILIDNPINFNDCSVFGTGETQWGMANYCKGVEEIKYHLQKYKKTVHHTLKVEQNPIGKENEIEQFTNKILKEIDIIGN